MGYLNINSIRNKIIYLRELISKAPIDIFCIDETKIDESFPNSQLFIENYESKNLESKNTGTICIEVTISKKSGVFYLHTDLQT